MTLTGALTGTSGTFSGDVTANTLQSNAFKSIASSGAHLQWNRDSAGGRTYLINQRGGGGGGISFGESTTGNVYTENMALSSTGNLTVVGSVTASGGITGTTANFSGNTSVGGTLTVTGGTTLNGAVAVNNSEITFNDVVGDKLNLYTDYGFGINGNNLTAFIPSASQRFSVRTGGTYTGFEVFTVSGAGNASLTGGLAAGGAISGTAGAFTGNVTVGGSVTATGLVDAYGGVRVRDGSTLEFGPSASTTDQIFIQRSNLATDQSRLQIILGDNNEGFGVSTTDEFQIGNIAGGTFAPRFRVAGSGDAIFSGAVTMNSLAAQRIDVSTSAGGVTNPNMIVGTNAMPGAQSGLGGNTALGVDTLSRNTTGFYNTASGFQSLTKNTIGNANTATGVFALTENTDGDFNTASGYYALTFNTTGNDNSAFGVNALITNTSGAENVAVGSRAMQSSSTGSQNVAVGFRAGFNNSTGSNNTLLGAAANVSASALTYATAIGSGSLVATSNTLALGRNSTADQVVIGTATRNDTFASTKLYVNGVTNLNGDLRGTTATFSGNTTVGGTLAVTGATTLNGAVAVNNSAITFNNILGDKLNLYSGFGFGINGDNLTAFIPSATQRFSLRTGGTYTGTEVFTVTGGGLITSTGGISTTTGAFSGAVTMNSLTAQRIDVSTSAGGVSFANMIVGTGAMAGAQSGTGANTALGINALNANTTGYANTGSGYRALELNSSGYGNTANGSDVLRSNTTGNNNTASGYFALANNTTGFDNTATGRLSGSNNTTGSSNTFLGSAADATTGALTYATAIGAGSTVATSSTIALGRIFATDQVVIGTASRNDTFANTKLYVNGVTNLNGDLRGTTGTFSGAVEVATGQEIRLGTYSENTDGMFITRVNAAADQSIFRISAFENLDDFGSPVADEFQIGRSASDRSSFTPVFRLAGSGNAILTGSMTANGGISSTTGTFSGNTTVGG
ncbi:MAG: hypothetical protein Q8M61_11955, partial [Limnobacter sp.]|nr:hypothetical protein [Limnobacter sp.]